MYFFQIMKSFYFKKQMGEEIFYPNSKFEKVVYLK